MSELKQKYFKQFKGNIILLGAISLFTSLFILLIPYANAKIINNAILGKYKEAGIICLVGGILYILKEILSKVLFVSKQEMINDAEINLKKEILQGAKNKSVDDEKINSTLDMVSSYTRDYRNLDLNVFKTFEELAVLTLMFCLDYRLGLICLIGGIIKFALNKYAQNLTEKQKREFKKIVKSKRKNFGNIVGSEINDNLIENTVKEENEYNNLNLKLEKEYNVQCIVEQIIMTLVQVILLALSCYMLYKNYISLFTFLLVFMYQKNGIYLFISVNELVKSIKEIKKTESKLNQTLVNE